jgi:hypothetical protein
MTTATSSLPLARAETRADLIRRLLAIAIAVGFAATLAKMQWVQNGTLPGPAEFNQMLALITALLATILGWDSHLLALRNAPLTDFPRFLLHVVLVFVFMFLLMASTHPGCLLWTLAVIFFLYLVSDLLAISARDERCGARRRDAGRGRRERGCHGFRRHGRAGGRAGAGHHGGLGDLFPAAGDDRRGTRQRAHPHHLRVRADRTDRLSARRRVSAMRRRSLVIMGVLIAALVYYRMLGGG